jgi:hypothetical protein
MRSIHNPAVLLLLALLMASAALPALADDAACLDFKWDVSKERALFAGTPAALTAGHDRKSAPVVVPDRLYKLRLMSQDQVAFSASPAKKMATTFAYAGLATLKIPVPGSYRIAVDLPFWIDVVSNGTLLQATDFQGQHSCSAPHKIVEFDLVGVRPFVLQFSNAGSDSVLLTVTPTPSRKL